MEGNVVSIHAGPNVQKEKQVINEMIRFYCLVKHHHYHLCKDCRNLKTYAFARLSLCPSGEEKAACSTCKAPCYKQKYHEKMEDVVYYAAPWMVLYHPVYSLKHRIKQENKAEI
jgi:hypothetical protein